MLHDLIISVLVFIGVFLIVAACTGRFSMGPTFSARYRRTALLGVRVRSGSGFRGVTPQHRSRPGTQGRV